MNTTAAQESALKSIDAILYINLDHRTDRLENIIKQLNTGNIATNLPIPQNKIQRISACYNKTCGAAGCAASHVKALELAIEQSWNRILILEDDFEWKTNNNEYILSCLRSIDTITIPWDVILLSTNKNGLYIVAEDLPNLQRIQCAATTSGYIVNSQEYIKKLRDLFQISKTQLERGGPTNVWAIDVVWKKLQATDAWYFFKNGLARQYSSYSDITKQVEYKHSDIF